jgi:hypothetical protein
MHCNLLRREAPRERHSSLPFPAVSTELNGMHPPLAKAQHQGRRGAAGVLQHSELVPACAEFIKALEACHERNVLNRFIGACNEDKVNLNMCFRGEARPLCPYCQDLTSLQRKRHASENRTKAKESREAVQARWAEIDKQEADSGSAAGSTKL